MEKYHAKLWMIFIVSLFVIQIAANPTNNHKTNSEISFANLDFVNKLIQGDMDNLKNQTETDFQPYKFTLIEKPHVVSNGPHYELSCRISNVLTVSNIHWIRGNKIESSIENLQRNKSSSFPSVTNDKEALLTIISKYVINCASKADKDYYTCVFISNNNHVYISSTYVDITSEPTKDCAPHKPVITQYISALLSAIGSNVVFYCNAPENSTVTWKNMHNEINSFTEISTDSHYEVYNGSLRINAITWLDMGTYICTAKTEYGECYAETFLYPTTNSENDQNIL